MEDVTRNTFNASEYNQDSSQVEWSTSFGTFRKRVLHPGKRYSKPSDLGAICIVTMTVSEVLSNLDLGYPVGVDFKLQTGEGDTEIAEVIDKCICSMRECEVCTLSIIRHVSNIEDHETFKKTHCGDIGGQGHMISRRADKSSNSGQDNLMEVLVKENSADVNFGKLSMSDADSEINTSTLEIQNLNDSFIKIELKSFENRHIWKLSMEQKFSVAKNHKAKGVELFQNGNFVQSFKRFSKGLKYLISMTPNSQIPSSVRSEFKLLHCQFYLNMAACQLKYNNFIDAKANCTKALNIEPQNVKGLYRRAQAYLEQGDLYSARNDLLTAIEIEPGSKAVKTLLTQVNQRQKEQL
ncbi:hypothetical protein CHS0354_000376 [Potamilus streckersoni]|uniref:Uncharacterized protein n=1 Tax=Potamilus streckersoni TaxID=2493646 RepID=A0AAE0VYF5_9BIVA|nr:hypothetical protein CHS0354_000376 [Potamilus streckersoni]